MIIQFVLAGLFIVLGLITVINYKDVLLLIAHGRNSIAPFYSMKVRTFRNTLESVYSDRFSYLDYRLYGLCFFTIGIIILDGVLRNGHTGLTDFFTQVFFYLEMILSLTIGLSLLWVFLLTRVRGTKSFVKGRRASHKDKKEP